MNKIKRKRGINIIFLYLELFLAGQLSVLLILGADFGLNSKWLSPHSEDGFYPKFCPAYPTAQFFFYYEDDIAIGDGETIFSPEIHIDKLLSYSFYDGTIFFKCRTRDGDTVYFHSIDNPEKLRPRCDFEQIASYPENAEEILIEGNEFVIYSIRTFKWMVIYLLIVIVFIHSIVLCISVNWKRRGSRHDYTII